MQLQHFENQFLPNALRKFFKETAPLSVRNDILSDLITKFSERFCACNPHLQLSQGDFCCDLASLHIVGWVTGIALRIPSPSILRDFQLDLCGSGLTTVVLWPFCPMHPFSSYVGMLFPLSKIFLFKRCILNNVKCYGKKRRIVSDREDMKMPSVLWHCWLGVGKSIRPVKSRVMTCWCGCLSVARCKWFAYGLAMPLPPHHLLLH